MTDESRGDLVAEDDQVEANEGEVDLSADDDVMALFDAGRDRVTCVPPGIEYVVCQVDSMFDALLDPGGARVVGCVVRDYARLCRLVFVEGPFQFVPRDGLVGLEYLVSRDLFMARLNESATVPVLEAILTFAFRHHVRIGTIGLPDERRN